MFQRIAYEESQKISQLSFYFCQIWYLSFFLANFIGHSKILLFEVYLEMKCQKLWPSQQANPWSVQHFGNEICPNIFHQICEREERKKSEKNYTDIKLHFPRLDFLALNEVRRPLRLYNFFFPCVIKLSIPEKAILLINHFDDSIKQTLRWLDLDFVWEVVDTLF